HLRLLQNRIHLDSVKDLVVLLSTDDLKDRREPGGNADHEKRRRERILERAWAAERLGQIGRKSKELVELLEFQVQHPSLDQYWIFIGLDSHTAARALGRLHSTESAP